MAEPRTMPLEAPTLDEITARVLAGKDEQIASLLDENFRLAQYVTRLENANSTAIQCLADEQRERELLVASVGNALGELSEYFRQANSLRGRGTPRSITHEPPRVAATGA